MVHTSGIFGLLKTKVLQARDLEIRGKAGLRRAATLVGGASMRDHRRVVVLLCIAFLPGGSALADDLAAAVAAGVVKASFSGTGGSSGDAVELSVAKTEKAGPGTLRLTIATGTRLRSRNPSAQNMVVAIVRGRVVDQSSFEPTSVIEVSGTRPNKYVLDAYCAEFEKDNPSADTGFFLEPPDPMLACIFRNGEGLSTEARQAAVWVYTDRISYPKMNDKFPLSKADWAQAQAVVAKCHASR